MRLFQDNKSFFYLADTMWFGATKRYTLEEFESALKLRTKQGFTAIQIVAGVPPEVPFFSKDAENNGGHPFTKDFKLNLRYLDEFDKRIHLILKHNMTPVIFGGWGHHIDITGVNNTKNFWSELIKRYGDQNVIFCLTGEADVFLNGYERSKINKASKRLSHILGKLSPALLQKIGEIRSKSNSGIGNDDVLLKERVKKWNEVGNYVASINKNRKPLTIHVTGRTDANTLFNNPKWLDINSIQSGHDKKRLYFMRQAMLVGRKPIINLEPWYEGILGNFKAHDQRKAFIISMFSGASGHSYGAHGVWQKENNDGFMNHWGDSSYQKALHFKGAEQIGLLKSLLKSYKWIDLKPDFEIITPQFSKTHTNYPIACNIGSKFYAIYFPERAGMSFELKLTSKAILTWINPTDISVLKRIKSDKGKVIIKPDYYGNEDKLLFLKLL